MAAIDSFEFLFRQISSTLGDVRDVLAVIGAYYVARKSLSVISHIADAGYVYFYSRIAQEEDLRRKFGLWAVVTGGSDGIGKAYAFELARRGLNIVLIARGERKLIRAITEIEKEFQVKAAYIVADFASDQGVYDTIKEGLADKEIGILVNNVGVMYDYPQMFLDVPESKLWQLIHVNVAAATLMTHMVLPDMVKRKTGAIVNVSSGSCSKITPQMTVYAATKTYLDYLSRALEFEYKSDGIVVQCLMPFYVATRMTRYSETLSKTSYFIPSAASFASAAVRTLCYSSRTAGYFPHLLMRWCSDICPEWLWKRGATRLNAALREQARKRLHRHTMATSASAQSMSDS